MFSNPKRTHDRNGMLSPTDFENRQKIQTNKVPRRLGAPQGALEFERKNEKSTTV